MTCTLINNGTIRAGGGGGGSGGAGGSGGSGGQGRTSYTYYGSYGSWYYDLYINASSFVVHAANTTTQWRYQGTTIYNNNYGHGPWGTTRDHGSYRYQREGNSGYQASGYTGGVNVGSNYNRLIFTTESVVHHCRQLQLLQRWRWHSGQSFWRCDKTDDQPVQARLGSWIRWIGWQHWLPVAVWQAAAKRAAFRNGQAWLVARLEGAARRHLPMVVALAVLKSPAC